MKVYHYTDKKGYNAVKSGNPYIFKASKPKYGNPKAAYFTTLSPEELSPKDYKAKLGLTKAKSEYFFEMDVDSSKLKDLKGGRGQYIKYSPDDLEVPRDKVTRHGSNPKPKGNKRNKC